jgi:pseudaminic acid synthase
MSRTIMIAGRSIGRSHRPFIIAEMSGNHNQSLDRALAIVEAAAKAGAHGLKLQTYTADTMTLDLDRDEFFIEDPNSLWSGRSLHKLYQEAYTPWEWHAPIFERARALGLIPFSTPFDVTAVDFLEQLGVPCYKIASFENTDLPLIRKVAATGKPMIVSTGMATVADIDEAVRAAKEAGCKDLILLKCTSTYPAAASDTNLLTIPHMRALFDCEVGLSDHTFGIGAGVASIALGATVIEKHFTLARADGGVDSTFSMEPDEMAALVVETERAWMALGGVYYGLTEKENKSLIFRRSLYVSENLAPGDALSEKNLRIVRPGLGLPPKYFDTLIGKRVGRVVRKGTPMSWDLLMPTDDMVEEPRHALQGNARA